MRGWWVLHSALFLFLRTSRKETRGAPIPAESQQLYPPPLQPQISPQACFSLHESETANCLELANPATAGALCPSPKPHQLFQGNPRPLAWKTLARKEDVIFRSVYPLPLHSPSSFSPFLILNIVGIENI